MKETKKQIKAQVINEVQKQFSAKVACLESNREHWRKCFFESMEECRKLRANNRELEYENESLKQKVVQYEEWIERMQEFCGLPDGERQQAFITYMDGVKAKAERDKEMKHTADFLNRMASIYLGNLI